MTPTDSQAARLLPCPFCGNDVNDDEGCFPCSPKYWEVRCGNPACFAHDPVRSTREEAITAWNTRPREPAGEVDDDLRQRCADILTWRKTGSLPFGTALRKFAEDRRFDRHETDRLRAAEDATLHEAATALAAAVGKSNG